MEKLSAIKSSYILTEKVYTLMESIHPNMEILIKSLHSNEKFYTQIEKDFSLM